MDEKRNALRTVGILCAIIIIFAVADLFGEDKLYSESENRLLASRPSFSRDALLSGEFTDDYETYLSDQFVGRDKWISIKTAVDILLQKKEINGVYLGADRYLIEKHAPEQYTDAQELQRMAQLEKLVKRWDAKVMLVPTADNILSDKMPAYASYYDQTGLLESVRKRVGDKHYIDVYGILKDHAGEEIYYRTDHHWNSQGAYYGYLAWADAMNKAPVRYTEQDREVVAEDFLGTLHSRIQTTWKKDTIFYYPQTEAKGVEVTYDFSDRTDSFYSESYLDTKNKYGFFLDDNHAFVEIHTTVNNHKNLFVIRDSYASCMIPMLAGHYENIYVMDLRYFNGKLFPFMEQYVTEGDDVLVLYNCIHFLENFQYY